MPHLSLAYGDLSHAVKEEIIAELGRRFDASFVANSIGLCLPAGPPAGWRTIGPFRLTR
jgi:hypothetical protein